MASPDNPSSAATHRLGKASRLRVVQDHDVAGAYRRGELGRVRPKHRLIVDVLGLAEWIAIAVRAMEQVVQPLRDGKEPLVAVEDHPAGVDAGPADVRQQRFEHLGDAAAHRCRVDAHHRGSVQLLAEQLAAPTKGVDSIGVGQPGEHARIAR